MRMRPWKHRFPKIFKVSVSGCFSNLNGNWQKQQTWRGDQQLTNDFLNDPCIDKLVHCISGHLEVSWNGGTPSHHPFSWDFPLQPSILGYHHLWKPRHGNMEKALRLATLAALPTEAIKPCLGRAWGHPSGFKGKVCLVKQIGILVNLGKPETDLRWGRSNYWEKHIF